FTLEQMHGGGHVIGKFRLSVTGAKRRVQADPVPPFLRPLLAIPASNRTDVQRAELALTVLRQQCRQELAALPPPQKVYAATSDFPPATNFKPARGCRPVYVLRRGDISMPGKAATPGALSCVGGIPSRFKLADPKDEGARRAALAAWLTHHDNVLTWR